jgi:hypothetical protein
MAREYVGIDTGAGRAPELRRSALVGETFVRAVCAGEWELASYRNVQVEHRLTCDRVHYGSG